LKQKWRHGGTPLQQIFSWGICIILEKVDIFMISGYNKDQAPLLIALSVFGFQRHKEK